MPSVLKRAVAAGVTVVAAAAVNVATGVLTQHWAAAWWAALGVILIGNVIAQVYLTIEDHSPLSEHSICVGGDVSGIVNTGDGATISQRR